MTKLLNRARDMSRTLDHTSMLEEKQALGGLIDSMYTKLGILQTIDQSIIEITAAADDDDWCFTATFMHTVG